MSLNLRTELDIHLFRGMPKSRRCIRRFKIQKAVSAPIASELCLRQVRPVGRLLSPCDPIILSSYQLNLCLLPRTVTCTSSTRHESPIPNPCYPILCHRHQPCQAFQDLKSTISLTKYGDVTSLGLRRYIIRQIHPPRPRWRRASGIFHLKWTLRLACQRVQRVRAPYA